MKNDFYTSDTTEGIENSCCFTGHRSFSATSDEVKQRLLGILIGVYTEYVVGFQRLEKVLYIFTQAVLWDLICLLSNAFYSLKTNTPL